MSTPRQFYGDIDNRPSHGVQARLRLAAVPAGAEALIGTDLVGKTLSIAGAYKCLIPIDGLASAVRTHIKTTLDGFTAATELMTLLHANDISDSSSWEECVAGTSDGDLVSGTRQVASVDILGEHWALLTLTLSGSGTAVITKAEFNGI